MSPTLCEIPCEIVTGMTVRYTRTPAAYPADDGWALHLYLRATFVVPAGDSGDFDSAGVADGDHFDFTLTGAGTDLAPGRYRWMEIATKAGESFLYDEGHLVLLPNLATATPAELQDPDELRLAALDELILARITGGTFAGAEGYSIAGRSITHGANSLAQLRAWRAQLWRKIQRKRCGGNNGWGGPQVRARFSGVGSER